MTAPSPCEPRASRRRDTRTVGLGFIESQRAMFGDEYYITTELTGDTVATLTDESRAPGYEDPHGTLLADAEFIAEARTDIVTLPDLVAELQSRLGVAVS
jgi:hypothetical protein